MLPERNDVKRIRSRAGKKRCRPAKDCDYDSLDEARKKPKRVAAKEKQLASGLLSDSEGEDSVPEASSIVYEQAWWNMILWVQEVRPIPPKDTRRSSSQPVGKQCVHFVMTSFCV